MPYGIITAVKPNCPGAPEVKVMVRDPDSGEIDQQKPVFSADSDAWSKEAYVNSRNVSEGTLVFFEIEKVAMRGRVKNEDVGGALRRIVRRVGSGVA